MGWIPPNCDSLDFTVDGVYAPPLCDQINFDIGGTAPHEILSSALEINIDSPTAEFFQGDIIASDYATLILESEDSYLDPLIPIASDYMFVATWFDQHDIEVLPDIVTGDFDVLLNFDEASVRGTEAQHLPIKIDVGKRSYSWTDGKISDDSVHFPFGDGEHILHRNAFSTKPLVSPDHQTHCSWITQYTKDNRVATPYSDFQIIDFSLFSVHIGKMEYLDDHYTKPWGGNQEKVDWHFTVPYNEPGAHDVKKTASWDTPIDYDFHFRVPWGAPGAHDTHKHIPWGPFSYYTLCYGDIYAPPKPCSPINFEFPSKYGLIGNVCEGIKFFLDSFATDPDPRCPYDHQHSGIRDRYPGIQIPDIQFPPAKKVYYMLNSVLVKEILTNHPIEVMSVDATIDRDSWLWQFNVTVASRDCLELIKPTNGVYAHIQIDINGYSWLCTVEGWRESRTFGKETWTITGRSPSIMFSAPIALKASNTETIGKQGEALFNDIVGDGSYIPKNWPTQLSSWEGDWSSYTGVTTGFKPYADWHVPANTLSYTDKTPIEVLQDITTAIGAYIQTDPSQNIFHVKPLYKHPPWSWDSSNSGIDWVPIIEDQCKEIARSTKLQPYYEAIHVIGENIGGTDDGGGDDPSNTACFVDVIRQGVGPSIATYAPMATHPLVTSSKVGLEYGRMILGNTGEWIEHTLRLGVLCPDSESQGLFLPGTMLTVLERGFPWYGQVKSTSIVAAKTNNAFTVNQQIGVEEFVKN